MPHGCTEDSLTIQTVHIYRACFVLSNSFYKHKLIRMLLPSFSGKYAAVLVVGNNLTAVNCDVVTREFNKHLGEFLIENTNVHFEGSVKSLYGFVCNFDVGHTVLLSRIRANMDCWRL